MAKKIIMTDFNSLKGKLSFSENCPVVADRKSHCEAVKKTDPIQTEPGSVLKEGQSVVLMDSDLRGKIVSIGKNVLKAAIRKELDEVLALRCSYSVGNPAVTVVSIK